MNETTYRIKDELKRFGEEFEAYAKNQVQSIDSFQRLHAADVKRNKDTIAALSEEKQKLQELILSQQQTSVMEAQRLDAMQKEAQQLKAQAQRLPNELAVLKAKQVEAENINHQKAVELNSFLQEKKIKSNDLNKSIAFFRDRLGLEFETKNGMLRVTLRNVDVLRPDRTLSFLLHVDEKGQYHVHDCKPTVPNMDKMIAELARTEDISFFIQRMRRSFKASLTSL